MRRKPQLEPENLLFGHDFTHNAKVRNDGKRPGTMTCPPLDAKSVTAGFMAPVYFHYCTM